MLVQVLRKGLPARDMIDLARVTQVAETTILSTYARMHPHLRSLIPADITPPMKTEEWSHFPPPRIVGAALRALNAELEQNGHAEQNGGPAGGQ